MLTEDTTVLEDKVVGLGEREREVGRQAARDLQALHSHRRLFPRSRLPPPLRPPTVGGRVTAAAREDVCYRVTSLTIKLTPLGLYRRPMPRVLGGSSLPLRTKMRVK